MFLKLAFSTIASLIIFGAQVLDEKKHDEKPDIQLYTPISILVGAFSFTWFTSARFTKLIDRVQRTEDIYKEGLAKAEERYKEAIAAAKPYDDSALKADLNHVRASVSGMKAEFADFSAQFNSMVKKLEEVASERAEDMDKLRKQLKTNALFDSVAQPTGLRVLIVDDNTHDVDIIRRRIASTFIVDHCSTLTQAHMKISRDQYDCVLLDLSLPDSRLNSTVADFVTEHPEMLVIVLTGHDDEATSQRCFEQGADDVWIKGQDDVDLRVITRKLKEAIWRRQRLLKG